jgi:anti-sigma factor RsiW
MHAEPPDELTDDELADLARLADGTLPAERRAEVEARVAASQRFASVIEQQGMAIDALRTAVATGAPARLRADVERRRGAHRALARRRGRLLIGGAIAAAAAVLLALVLVVPNTLSGDPSISDAAALAHRAPTKAAPAGRAGHAAAAGRGRRRRPVPRLHGEVRLEARRCASGRPFRAQGEHRLLQEGRPDDRVHDRLRRPT